MARKHTASTRAGSALEGVSPPPRERGPRRDGPCLGREMPSRGRHGEGFSPGRWARGPPAWERVFGITSNILALSTVRAGRWHTDIRRLRAGTRSCWTGVTGPPEYDYRGRGAPSHCVGRIHPYVQSCSATGADRDRSDWRTRLNQCGMDERPRLSPRGLI